MPLQVRQPRDERGGRERKGDAHGIRGPSAPHGDDRGAEEGTDEDADPVHAPERRQGPGAHRGGDDFSEVGVPREPEDRPRKPHDEDRDRQRHDRAGQPGADHPETFGECRKE